MTLEIGKNAVTALGMKPVQLVFEKRFEIHHMLPVYTAKRYIGGGSSVLISVKFGASYLLRILDQDHYAWRVSG
ncbi:hypothetical protein HFO49_29380 [Rhizobium leguminosarum]|nr:hypothetical protein [Rhizobium leguminosarum]MBY5605364.1 hypothetical protein [Rhizobium leguminosarum]